MRLVRNTTTDGTCKYALIRLDKLRLMASSGDDVTRLRAEMAELNLKQAQRWGILEYAGKGDREEAFVIKLKDINAAPALHAYSEAAFDSDPELAKDVAELALRADSREDRHIPD